MSTKNDYRALLADPTLLDHAVDFGWDVAVPVGGRRRGGFICCPSKRDAKRALALLREHEGFPNLMYVPGGDDYPDVVQWGGSEPELPTSGDDLARARSDVEDGRYYGYSDNAIRDFIGKKYSARIAAAALP